jgi:TRAP-type C4-dicarboxylate transport system substrate-binding protein
METKHVEHQVRFRRIGGSLVAATCLAASLVWTSVALAQEKPLIDKWLDGEVKAKFPPVTYNGPPIELRYSTFIGEFPIDVRAFKRLEAETNGKLSVRAYWGNTLANMVRGPFEAVSGGVVDFGNCYVSNSPGGITLHSALSTPFAFENSQQASWTAMELYPEFLKKEYEAKGVYMIRMGLSRPSQLLMSKTSVDKLADLKGKKIWTLGSPYVNDMIKALGASPTFIPIPDVYTAMQSGVLDGVANHDASFALFKWVEVARNHTKADLWAQTTEYCLNKQKFDGLPSDLKAIFYHWAQMVTQAYAQRYYDDAAETAIADMRKRGIKMDVLSDDERKRWSAATQPVVDAFIKQNSQNRSVEFFAAMKAKSEKYSKMSGDDITKMLLDKPIPGIINF